MTSTNAYQNGWNAHQCGLGRFGNPHTLNTTAWRDWDDGWRDAAGNAEIAGELTLLLGVSL